MIDFRSRQLWRIAVGLAVIGGLLALFNVVQDYRRTGELDWGHLALAVGIPALFYVERDYEQNQLWIVDRVVRPRPRHRPAMTAAGDRSRPMEQNGRQS